MSFVLGEPIVNYEVAKLLNELGFPSRGYNGFGRKFYHARTKSILWSGRTGRVKQEDLYAAIPLATAQRWIRVTFGLEVFIRPWYNRESNLDMHYSYHITGMFGDRFIERYKHSGNIYKGVLNDGLKEALEICKNN